MKGSLTLLESLPNSVDRRGVAPFPLPEFGGGEHFFHPGAQRAAEPRDFGRRKSQLVSAVSNFLGHNARNCVSEHHFRRAARNLLLNGDCKKELHESMIQERKAHLT